MDPSQNTCVGKWAEGLGPETRWAVQAESKGSKAYLAPTHP